MNNISNSIADINTTVVEAMLNVYDAMDNYRNKQQFITDYTNGVEFPESYLEAFNNIGSDDVVMEAADTNVDGVVDTGKYLAYRFDFLGHNAKNAKLNKNIAASILAAFEASMEAKKNEGKSYNKLNGVVIKRDPNMQALINRLYSGKIEALYITLRALKTYESNKSCYVKYDVIPFGVAEHRQNGNVGNDILEVKFILKLPKVILTKQNFEILEYVETINDLRRQQREIIKTKGTSDPRVTELAKQIVEKNKNAPYGYDTTNTDACKALKNDTCYTDKMEDKKLVEYEVGFHCLKNAHTSEEDSKLIDKINSFQRGTTKAVLTDDENNTRQLIALAKQFRYIAK